MKPCILPWINFGTSTFGRPRVCGYSSVKTPVKLKDSKISDEWNNEYFKTIRKNFLNQEWPENCSRCKYVEENGGVSKRQDSNHMWYSNYNHLISLTEEDGSVPYQPPHMDVRTGTVCNFKCIHCGPGASSKWQEDASMLYKYGYDQEPSDNKWIAQDSNFWDSLDISQIKRYNFLGGESFYNKRHNEFIKKVNDSPYAKDVEVMYVSNGSLMNEEKLNDLINFKKIKLRLSVDTLGVAGEYFRYGLDWDDWHKKCKFIDDFVKTHNNFDVAFQWTCSNISIFYLIDTYDFIREEYENIRFLFENHVTQPYHMSAQNLPLQIKKNIKNEIESYPFKETHLKQYPFYVSHMMEKNSWSTHGSILLNYLDDLDEIRKIDWAESFKEMDLKKYDTRNLDK
tara:strand:- start:271 stop:1461 length:1191 start_codon:yes stop_codon:yes gene_type:complete